MLKTDMDEAQKQVSEIEATHKALLESIEATKDLAEKADALLQKHKETLEEDQPSD